MSKHILHGNEFEYTVMNRGELIEFEVNWTSKNRERDKKVL